MSKLCCLYRTEKRSKPYPFLHEGRFGSAFFMVYTDKIHLVADCLDELHNFALRIGLKRSWFQNHSRHPHYDLLGERLKLALKNGAIVIGSKQLVRISRKLIDESP